MNENEILAEIRQTRAEHARECGLDIHLLFERMRDETEKLKTEGWRVIYSAESETSPILREDPPK